MPAGFHLKVYERAKELYTQGCSAPEVVKQLEIEKLHGIFTIEGVSQDRIRVPESPSTISRWAKNYKWRPDWREARKRQLLAIKAGEPFAASGIKDPILHLAKVIALQRVEVLVSQYPDAEDRAIREAVMTRVERELQPGSSVMREIRLLLLQAIVRTRQLPPRLTVEQEEEQILKSTPLERRTR